MLSSGVQDRLNLTAEQKKRSRNLQKEIDGKINSILTEEQRKQLEEIKKGGGRAAQCQGRLIAQRSKTPDRPNGRRCSRCRAARP